MILSFLLQFFVALFGCAVYMVAADSYGFEDRIPQNLLFVFICTMVPIRMNGWDIGILLIIIIGKSTHELKFSPIDGSAIT